MLGCRNGVDKVVLRLAADLILPRPAFSGSICVELSVRLLKGLARAKPTCLHCPFSRGLP